jgi:hypothetical protein
MITKIKEYLFNTANFSLHQQNISEPYLKQTIAFLNELEKEQQDKLPVSDSIYAGAYKLTNENHCNTIGLEYAVYVSGNSPFLKIDYVWDRVKNRTASEDVLRGKEFKWERIN